MGENKEKIFIVSEKENQFYNLTDLIPEMMEVEGLTQQECIDYFMDHTEQGRYKVFPADTPALVISDWILHGKDGN